MRMQIGVSRQFAEGDEQSDVRHAQRGDGEAKGPATDGLAEGPHHRDEQRDLEDRQQRQRATTTLRYSLSGLYTCRAYQDRMWDAVHACIQNGDVPDFRFV